MSDVVQRISEMRERYRAGHAQLDQSEREELALLQAECAQDGHEWKIHQVVGEGRFCVVCDANDPDYD